MEGSLVVVKIGELHELLLRRERADFLCRGLSNRSTCHANEAMVAATHTVPLSTYR